VTGEVAEKEPQGQPFEYVRWESLQSGSGLCLWLQSGPVSEADGCVVPYLMFSQCWSWIILPYGCL